MHIDYLVRMANDIGSFFASEPDAAVAASSIYGHIRKFWDPRMRAQIVAYYNEERGTDLEGPVREAIGLLAKETASKATG